MSTVNAGEISVSIIVRTAGMERGLSRATGIMNTFQRSASIAAGVIARDLFFALSDATREAITLGASMETLERSFDALAGVGGQATVNIEQLDKATMGMISRVDLLTQANRALSLGVPVDALDELFIGAIRLGKAMGLDAATSVEKLILGMGRLSFRLLDDIGIIVRASEANEIYATKLGRTVESLTAAERSTAFHTLTIERLNEKVAILGDNIGEADQSMTQWDATIRNVTVSVGELLTPLAAVLPVIKSLGPVMAVLFLGFSQQIAAIIPTMLVAQQAFTALSWAVAALGGPIGLGALLVGLLLLPTAFKTVNEFIDRTTGRTQELTDATNELAAAEMELADATDEVSQALSLYNNLLDDLSDASENQLELQDEMIDAQEALAKATDRVSKASERLEKSNTRLTDVTQDYQRAQRNLLNFIVSTFDASMEYNEILKEQQFLIQGTVPTLDRLTDSLDSAQVAYDVATGRVNRLSDAMDRNNRVLSINSIEQLKIRDAMQDRQDAANIAILGVENEITALEKLGKVQGFLTFAQRQELTALKDKADALKDAGGATLEETRRLAELADQQREVNIQNAETAIKLEDATDKQDKQNKKLEDAQGLVDTLTNLNNVLNMIYGDQQDALEDVDDAADEYDDALDDLGVKTIIAEDATDKHRTAIEKIDTAFGDAADSLEEYNQKLREQADLSNKAREAEERHKEELSKPVTTIPGVDPFLDSDVFSGDFGAGGGGLGGTTNNITSTTTTNTRREGDIIIESIILPGVTSAEDFVLELNTMGISPRG